jgi:hypothetical protein
MPTAERGASGIGGSADEVAVGELSPREGPALDASAREAAVSRSVAKASAAAGAPAVAASYSDVEAARYLADATVLLQQELGKVIVGQQRVIEEVLIAIFARAWPRHGS